MNHKVYRQVRKITVIFVGLIVSISIVRDNFLLTIAGILTGITLLTLARVGAKIKTDERQQVIQEKSSRIAYSIFTPTIGIVAILLLLPSKAGLAVFSRGEWLFLESVGVIFAYLSLLLIAVYAVSYYLIGSRYGGVDDDQ